MSESSYRRASEGPTQAPPARAPEAPAFAQRGGNEAAAAALSAAAPTVDASTPQQGPATARAADSATAAVTPEARATPAPVVPGVQQRTVLGVQIIGEGVSPSALDSCADFVRLTVGQRADIQQRLQRERVALVIVPRGKKMTEVSQFAGLRGQHTIDGRLWDDVRGSGGTRVAGGLWAVGVPEENLVDLGTDAYGGAYSVGLHEFSHTIHSKGVSAAERREITALYQARRAAGGPWTEAYGASNEREYFAQCTNCYFGENDRVGQNGADWLRTNDAAMFALLQRVYGPPPAQEAGGAGGAAGPATGAAGATGASAPAAGG